MTDRSAKRLIIWVVLLWTLAVLSSAAYAVNVACSFDDYDMPPRLIGIGCKGAGGPLWADEEDDFPAPCKEIKGIPLYR